MKNVLLLLANGFEIYEASAFIDVFGWNQCDGDRGTRLLTGGLSREVESAFSQRMVVDLVDGQIDVADFDALAVPGGFPECGFLDDGFDERFLSIVRRFHGEGKIVASICLGALPLARSGILAGKAATTYNQEEGRWQRELVSYGARLSDGSIVRDVGVVTSWNPSTAVDVAFALLEDLTGSANMLDVRSQMGF